MKLELPSKKVLLVSLKYSLLLIVPFLIFVWWNVKQDSNLPEIEKFLLNSQQQRIGLGTITSVGLSRATYVDDAINRAGVKTPGYSLYIYTVTGAEGSAIVTVRAEQSATGQGYVYSLTDIMMD